MSDIVDKINSVISRIETDSRYARISKETVITVLEMIKEDVPEDEMFLGHIINDVTRHWCVSNTRLNESFERILKYYGIIDGSKDRKTILEAKGKTIVRRFIALTNKRKIKELLDNE